MSGDAYSWGPEIMGNQTRFRIWAPDCQNIAIIVEGLPPEALHHVEEGWREAVLPAPAGSRYQFRVGDLSVPDPASRAQAETGESIVVDSKAYRWRHPAWRGRPWEEAIIYELHVGLLGGFRGVEAILPKLADIGITAIELMPIADFPGSRNWGYDGVLPFAPANRYGTPDELKNMIDTAHGLGVMVFLDVVYNHFGPDGNFLPAYASGFFRYDRHTPWGSAMDFRKEAVRNFFIENASYWVEEFHIDGLRFDAVHAMADDEFLCTIAKTLRAHIPPDRHLHLVIENERNDAALLENCFTAQWNDDIHHALHVMLTGETAGYYIDYAVSPAEALARGLKEGFIYQGDHSDSIHAPRGTPSSHLPTTSFIAFLQNHDHVGNRAFGERLTTLIKDDALKAAIALILLSPQIPLIFMGEEAGARESFLYFAAHKDPELANAVREGRRAEFSKFPQFTDEKRRELIPDPNALETFEKSRPKLVGDEACAWNSIYKKLLRVRATYVIPGLKDARGVSAEVLNEKAVIARWSLSNGSRLTIASNFSGIDIAGEFLSATPIWGKLSDGLLKSMTTVCWVESA